ncbi:MULTISPECIES: hypothetical protein [unclassified Rubrivivax]|uniref:hypothetical protein n=1 Tax=unclassified Rubrivivax TaxID=2649762 RepID=UPI001E3FD6FA|nr:MULTISPECIES: hypothetical protein [unclassified Rubrivivax]MCC9598885.1 hypothetical protein [Rubrivivax sp. JA1055]MCC9648585.1 hypothetical protein [Rubrivivax sp. JA1029]
MEITNNPPRFGKAELLDHQFGDWWLFLNTWGTSAFLLFLACLGTGEHKHFCALLSSLLLGWGYWAGRKRFPLFIRRLRRQRSAEAKALESEIFRDHFFKKLLTYFPLILGIATLGALLAWPAFNSDWCAYVSFWPR